MLVPEHVQAKCQAALRELESLFPHNCQLTLLMRNIDVPGADMVVTKDNLYDVLQSVIWLIDVENEQQVRENN